MAKQQAPRSTIPLTPLVFVDPSTLPEAHLPGASMVHELPAELLCPAWDVLRAVHLYARSGQGGSFYDSESLCEWETELLRGDLDPGLRQPLAVIVGQLSAASHSSEHKLLSNACIAVADWALARGAAGTALAFLEAAALCSPEEGRYAVCVGRAYRSRGLLRPAERWLRRARSLTLWRKDWEAHALAVTTLGMVCWHEGAIAKALDYLHRARRVAKRHKYRVLEGEILHNLLVVAVTADDLAHVEEYAVGALERYLPDHHRLPALAYDLAYFWLTRGHAARALDVFRALLPHFPEPHQRLQVLAAISRAAGAAREGDTFEQAWTAAFQVLAEHRTHVSVPAALLDLGLGAAHFGRFEDARDVFANALRDAEARDQSDLVIRADAYLSAVAQRQNPDTLAEVPRRHASQRRTERLADQFVEVLSGGTVFVSA